MNKFVGLLLSSLMFTTSYAAQTTATIYSTIGEKKELGQVVFTDTDLGLLIIPTLTTLPPGLPRFSFAPTS